ncbi:MAG TPA: hypothetical protein PK812_08340 [Beijerinckiaceae bacterium]|nr:hypothetical protein [Beijerinckiaceae bacterium]
MDRATGRFAPARAGLLATGLIGVVATALPAYAQPRPMTSAMTCADAQALVKRAGARVLNFTPTTYDRVVADLRFCIIGQTLVPEFAPTRDAPRCFVGYVCREYEIDPG